MLEGPHIMRRYLKGDSRRKAENHQLHAWSQNALPDSLLTSLAPFPMSSVMTQNITPLKLNVSLVGSFLLISRSLIWG